MKKQKIIKIINQAVKNGWDMFGYKEAMNQYGKKPEWILKRYSELEILKELKVL